MSVEGAPPEEAGEGGEEEAGARRAIVAFSDRAELAWLRPLARGFRHCFVIVEIAPGSDRWLLVDPLSNGLEVRVLPQDRAGLLALLAAKGLLAVETVVRPPGRPRLPAPWTCVETVKRVLGIAAPWVVTPRQLFSILR